MINNRLINTDSDVGPTPIGPPLVFHTIIYTGVASQSITGVGFRPDLIWIKARTLSGYKHILVDSSRGAMKYLATNAFSVETTVSNQLVSFDMDGFTLDTGAANFTGEDYVAWCFKGGGTPQVNNDGTITTMVSANKQGGFSIITYTGNSIVSRIGHGLGRLPKFFIIKRLNGSSSDWIVWISPFSDEQYMTLNTTRAITVTNNFWGNSNVVPDINYINIGGSTKINASTANYICYAFAEVAGVSKFGTYSGSGSVNPRNWQSTGFEPAFIMIKNTANGYHWRVYDTKRNPSNLLSKVLYPDDDDAETTVSASIWVESDRWAPNSTSPRINAENEVYLFAVFANQFTAIITDTITDATTTTTTAAPAEMYYSLTRCSDSQTGFRTGTTITEQSMPIDTVVSEGSPRVTYQITGTTATGTSVGNVRVTLDQICQ